MALETSAHSSEQPSVSREVPITGNWTTTIETINEQTPSEEAETINSRANNIEKLMAEPLPESVLTNVTKIVARRVELMEKTNTLGAPPRKRFFMEEYLGEKRNQEQLAEVIKDLWGDENAEELRSAQSLGQYLEGKLVKSENIPALRAFGLLLLESGRNHKKDWATLTESEKQITRLGEMTLLLAEGARLQHSPNIPEADTARFVNSATIYAQSADIPVEYQDLLRSYLSQPIVNPEVSSNLPATRTRDVGTIEPTEAPVMTDQSSAINTEVPVEETDNPFATYTVDAAANQPLPTESPRVAVERPAPSPESEVTEIDPNDLTPVTEEEAARLTADAPAATEWVPTPPEPRVKFETPPIWRGEKLNSRDLVGIKETLDNLRATQGQEFALVQALLTLRQSGIKTKEHIRAKDIEILQKGISPGLRNVPLKYAQYLMYLQEYGVPVEISDKDQEALLNHWEDIVTDAYGAQDAPLEHASQYAMYLKKLGLKDFNDPIDRKVLLGNTEEWIQDAKPGKDAAFLARHLARLSYLGVNDYQKEEHREKTEQLIDKSLRALQSRDKMHGFARLMTTYQYLFGVKEIEPEVQLKIVQTFREDRASLAYDIGVPQSEQNKRWLSFTEFYRNLLTLKKTEDLKKQQQAASAAAAAAQTEATQRAIVEEAELQASRDEIDRRANALLENLALDGTTRRRAA